MQQQRLIGYLHLQEEFGRTAALTIIPMHDGVALSLCIPQKDGSVKLSDRLQFNNSTDEVIMQLRASLQQIEKALCQP